MSSQPLIGQESAWKDQDANIAEEDDIHSRRCFSLGDSSASSQASNRLTLSTAIQLAIKILLSILLIANLLTVAFISRGEAITQGKSGLEPNSAAAIFNFTSKVLHTQYGSDVSYMSLDPQYDWLWSTENDRYAGLIALDPPNEDGSIRWGAITM